jgi:hypothetical protein
MVVAMKKFILNLKTLYLRAECLFLSHPSGATTPVYSCAPTHERMGLLF